MKIPNTHFNATELLKKIKDRPKGVKISQFTDNYEIANLATTLQKPITVEGCKGFTALPNELLQHFEEWLKHVGAGKGRNKQPEN